MVVPLRGGHRGDSSRKRRKRIVKQDPAGLSDAPGRSRASIGLPIRLQTDIISSNRGGRSIQGETTNLRDHRTFKGMDEEGSIEGGMIAGKSKRTKRSH
jgi:hypothetical protein